MEYVFVYGTLLSGLSNNYLLEKANFMGEFESKQKMIMYGYRIPYVFLGLTKYSIKGEIYEVDNTVLARLDSLEGHPNWYKRVKKWFKNEVLEKTAWIYTIPSHHIPKNATVVPDGDFRRFNHGLL